MPVPPPKSARALREPPPCKLIFVYFCALVLTLKRFYVHFPIIFSIHFPQSASTCQDPLPVLFLISMLPQDSRYLGRDFLFSFVCFFFFFFLAPVIFLGPAFRHFPCWMRQRVRIFPRWSQTCFPMTPLDGVTTFCTFFLFPRSPIFFPRFSARFFSFPFFSKPVNPRSFFPPPPPSLAGLRDCASFSFFPVPCCPLPYSPCEHLSERLAARHAAAR